MFPLQSNRAWPGWALNKRNTLQEHNYHRGFRQGMQMPPLFLSRCMLTGPPGFVPHMIDRRPLPENDDHFHISAVLWLVSSLTWPDSTLTVRLESSLASKISKYENGKPRSG